MQMQDFALARQKVVFDIEAVHGLKMAVEDCNRDQFGNCSGFISALFEFVKRLQTGFFVVGSQVVPLRDFGVEVPAVVIKTWRFRELLDFCSRFLFDVQKADDYVCDLDAGVVDIVLYIYLAAGELE